VPYKIHSDQLAFPGDCASNRRKEHSCCERKVHGKRYNSDCAIHPKRNETVFLDDGVGVLDLLPDLGTGIERRRDSAKGSKNGFGSRHHFG